MNKPFSPVATSTPLRDMPTAIEVKLSAPYAREAFAYAAFWYDGALCCGHCDAPIYDARCDGCGIAYTGKRPVEPVLTYSEGRQAFHDSSVYLSEVRAARHFGRSGYGA